MISVTSPASPPCSPSPAPPSPAPPSPAPPSPAMWLRQERYRFRPASQRRLMEKIPPLPSSHRQVLNKPGCRQPLADRSFTSRTQQDSTVLRCFFFFFPQPPEPRPPIFEILLIRTAATPRSVEVSA